MRLGPLAAVDTYLCSLSFSSAGEVAFFPPSASCRGISSSCPPGEGCPVGTWGAGAGKPSFCCSSPGGEGEGEGVSLVSTAVVAGVRETSQSANNRASFRGGGGGGNFVPLLGISTLQNRILFTIRMPPPPPPPQKCLPTCFCPHLEIFLNKSLNNNTLPALPTALSAASRDSVNWPSELEKSEGFSVAVLMFEFEGRSFNSSNG